MPLRLFTLLFIESPLLIFTVIFTALAIKIFTRDTTLLHQNLLFQYYHHQYVYLPFFAALFFLFLIGSVVGRIQIARKYDLPVRKNLAKRTLKYSFALTIITIFALHL